ncbi:MAG: phBC6A51 family helix-turn-helix protein [bacterium]
MSSSIIQRRQKKQKELLIEMLRKFPNIEVACGKSGVSRATYYRFRNNDEEFSKLAEEASQEGIDKMNDMAEANLLSAIQNKNLSAIIFWLKHRHKAYSTKVEVEATVHDLTLTPEQQALIRRALKLSNLTEGDNPNDQK